MSTQGSNDDCYFYYYSSCAKGDDCLFRHSESALGTETVCSSWREGRCYRSNCKFRHMESRIKRSAIPCYWENQPGGCRKPHCVFFHQKNRFNIHATSETQRLILPVQAATITQSSPTSDEVKESVKTSSHVAPDPLPVAENISLSPPSQPVEPVVVNFDEGEESDAESVSSTPVKSIPSQVLNFGGARMNITSTFSENSEDIDFGVKTLEQLRMEKIHRESEHFYKPDDSDGKVMTDESVDVSRITSLHADSNMFCYPTYDELPVETSKSKSESVQYSKQGFYPPDSSSIIPLSNNESPVQNMSVSSVDSEMDESQLSRDLRDKIIKKRAVFTKIDIESPQKRVVNLKRPQNQTEDPLGFKIKTLSEIRKEKERKVDENTNSIGPSTDDEVVKITQTSQLENNPNGVQQIPARRKIKKLFRDPLVVLGADRNGEISPIGSPKNGNSFQIEKNEIQNGYCEIEYNGEKIYLQKGKRKESDTFSSSEIIKKCKKIEDPIIESEKGLILTHTAVESIPSVTITRNTSENKNSAKKLQRPVIRRKSILLATSVPSVKIINSEQKNESSNKLVPESNNVDSGLEIMPSTDQELTATSSDLQPVEHGSRINERSASVDDFDHLFLNDADMTLDEGEENTDKKAEDLFLEIEQMLES